MLNYNEYTSCLEILDCISPVAKSASLVAVAMTRSGDDGVSPPFLPFPSRHALPFFIHATFYPRLYYHLQSSNVFPRSRIAI